MIGGGGVPQHHTKKQRSLAQLNGEPVYGAYDNYNFFKVY